MKFDMLLKSERYVAYSRGSIMSMSLKTFTNQQFVSEYSDEL